MKIETRLALISNGVFFVLAVFYAMNGVFVAVQERYVWVLYYGALCVAFTALGIWFTVGDTRLVDHRRAALMLTGKCIWNTAEFLHINLGRFGPIVFGWMVGVKGRRVQ